MLDPAGATPQPARLRVEYREAAALVPAPRNARTHSEQQVAQIAASIREFGWTNPILVDGENGVVAGHGRLLAANSLGIGQVPVIELAGLTAAQKRAYIIADNKLAENAGWDEALLAVELGALQDLGVDPGLLGFSLEEIDALFAPAGTEGATDPEAAAEPPVAPVAVAGDLWLLGRHRVLCGDATVAADVERALGGVEPHLMVTDPPYGVNYNPTWRDEAGGQFGDGKTKMRGRVSGDDCADWSEAWSLFAGDVAYVWHASLKTAEVLESLEGAGFDCRTQII